MSGPRLTYTWVRSGILSVNTTEQVLKPTLFPRDRWMSGSAPGQLFQYLQTGCYSRQPVGTRWRSLKWPSADTYMVCWLWRVRSLQCCFHCKNGRCAGSWLKYTISIVLYKYLHTFIRVHIRPSNILYDMRNNLWISILFVGSFLPARLIAKQRDSVKTHRTQYSTHLVIQRSNIVAEFVENHC